MSSADDDRARHTGGPTHPARQGTEDSAAADRARIDRQLLRLARWHYVVGGVTAFFAALGAPLIPTGWMLMRTADGPLPASVRVAAEMQGVEKELADPEIRAILGGWLVAAGIIVVALSLLHGAVIAYVGRCIARRKRWRLCVLFSIFDLTYLLPLPLGAALSVAALRLLYREDARRQFRERLGAAAVSAVLDAASTPQDRHRH